MSKMPTDQEIAIIIKNVGMKLVSTVARNVGMIPYKLVAFVYTHHKEIRAALDELDALKASVAMSQEVWFE